MQSLFDDKTDRPTAPRRPRERLYIHTEPWLPYGMSEERGRRQDLFWPLLRGSELDDLVADARWRDGGVKVERPQRQRGRTTLRPTVERRRLDQVVDVVGDFEFRTNVPQPEAVREGRLGCRGMSSPKCSRMVRSGHGRAGSIT